MSKFVLNKQQYKIMIIGLVVLFIGFALMVGGAVDDPTDFNYDGKFSFVRMTLAPFLVLSGFGVIMYAIMKRTVKEEEEK